MLYDSISLTKLFFHSTPFSINLSFFLDFPLLCARVRSDVCMSAVHTCKLGVRKTLKKEQWKTSQCSACVKYIICVNGESLDLNSKKEEKEIIGGGVLSKT